MVFSAGRLPLLLLGAHCLSSQVEPECLEQECLADGDDSALLHLRAGRTAVKVDSAMPERAKSDMASVKEMMNDLLSDGEEGSGQKAIEQWMRRGKMEMLDRQKSTGRLVSRLQSVLERKHKEATGHWGAPGRQHAFLRRIEGAIHIIKEIKGGGAAGRTGTESPHETDLGYPLTCVEALAFAANVSEALGLPWTRDSITGMHFLEFAEIILEHGPRSQQARDYFSGAIQLLSNVSEPVDIGWLNLVVGQKETYTRGGGVHAYRRVPKLRCGRYDPHYATRSLPKLDRPLVIGLVADWAGGTPEAAAVLRELKKQKPDVVIHLGDTYYSGTREEARDFWLEPMTQAFDKDSTLILQVPGNHDYYSEGGAGFFEVIDSVGHQEASYFVVRGEHFQILGIDTGILANFDLLFPKLEGWTEDVLTFLPEDQATWAREQLKIGKEKGLKTIMVSHHQLFSRKEFLGYGNARITELFYLPDEKANTFPWLKEFRVESEMLPGNLSADTPPAANTRLLSQFPPDLLEGVSAWYWGHEHKSIVFKPYAGLERGRLIGNGCITAPKDFTEYFGKNTRTCGKPWGGHPEVVEGSKLSTGDNFWGLSFATVTLDGRKATARHFQVLDRNAGRQEAPTWGEAQQFYEEEY